MMKSIIVVCGAILLACSKQSAANEEPVKTGTQVNASPFTLSIVPPDCEDQPKNGNRVIDAEMASQFYVVLTNTSDKPVTIFKDGCPWGYYNLSFEAVTSEGKTVKLEKSQYEDWNDTNIYTFCIPSGGSYVFVVRFTEKWNNLQEASSTYKPAMLKAVYEQKKNEKDWKNRVWIGRVESKPELFLIFRTHHP